MTRILPATLALGVVVVLAGLPACGRNDRDGGRTDAGGSGGGGQGGAGGAGADAGSGGSGATDGGGKTCGVGGTVGFPATDFRAPEVLCHWDQKVNVMSTPLVIDLDRDGNAELVFPAYDGKVHALRGDDCSEVWATAVVGLMAPFDLAAGDLDGDGKIEVAAVVARGPKGSIDDDEGIVVLGPDGKLLGELTDKRTDIAAWEPIAVANLDGKGPAEIVIGNSVFRYASGAVELLWVGALGGGSAPALADMDGDGIVEIVNDDWVVDGPDGKLRFLLPHNGFPAIADIEPSSPGPEIVLVKRESPKDGSGDVRVLAGTAAPEPGRLLMGPWPTGGGGGPPAVADYDNDGHPEIGVAGASTYTVYDPDCIGAGRPPECQADGIRWTSHSQDQSSYQTTSTVFDFNGDCQADVVYRDECWLRVYEGATGTVVFAASMTSNTGSEGAVVAATHATGRARIVLGTNDISRPKCPDPGTPEEYTKTPFTGVTQGVFVLKDPLDRWMPTRAIWNQNGYHVSNVDDDGKIPLAEAPSWLGDNSYRANVQRR